MKLFFFLVLLFTHTFVHAERADREQAIHIEADEGSHNDLTQVKTLIGHVKLTQGTLLIKADKAVLKTDAAGYENVTLYATAGNLVHFRQRLDNGPDLWMTGQAERMEYDQKTEMSKLFSRARLQRLQGSRVTEEVNGAFISYDSRTEFYSVTNTDTGVSKPKSGRVNITISPRVDVKKEKGP